MSTKLIVLIRCELAPEFGVGAVEPVAVEEAEDVAVPEAVAVPLPPEELEFPAAAVAFARISPSR